MTCGPPVLSCGTHVVHPHLEPGLAISPRSHVVARTSRLRMGCFGGARATANCFRSAMWETKRISGCWRCRHCALRLPRAATRTACGSPTLLRPRDQLRRIPGRHRPSGVVGAVRGPSGAHSIGDTPGGGRLGDARCCEVSRGGGAQRPSQVGAPIALSPSKRALRYDEGGWAKGDTAPRAVQPEMRAAQCPTPTRLHLGPGSAAASRARKIADAEEAGCRNIPERCADGRWALPSPGIDAPEPTRGKKKRKKRKRKKRRKGGRGEPEGEEGVGRRRGALETRDVSRSARSCPLRLPAGHIGDGRTHARDAKTPQSPRTAARARAGTRKELSAGCGRRH